ncbi:helix-turn-helix domain-containing protein [Lichenicoccus sp.]|uniref:TetR/AcrR family transcriptional regulator n=1 Tax=Lichenicoccus sp. TaxID=2781899 RepID=UPI003D0D3FE3
MSSTSDPGLRRAFAAALTLFGRHGFQRTSMADIAREAGIARATLYLRFPDKRALFEALAASLVDEALARAEAAWLDDASLSENIAATLLAKDLGFFHMLHATPHGAELLNLEAELTAAHVARLDTGFAALLAERGRQAAEAGADLTAFGGAAGFAAFLATAGSSLKHEARTEEAFRLVVHRLARVSACAAGRD